MGLLSLPAMLKRGYEPEVACGTICASGTLGQIIPPSIVLVLLGDVLSAAYQQAQRTMGKYPPDSVSVGDLFVGALLPGVLLVLLYIAYLSIKAWMQPHTMPAASDEELAATPVRWLPTFAAPVMLILLVLGSILGGYATPTEASAVGAVGALVLAAFKRELNWRRTMEIARQTALTTAMVFMILVGASVFSLVFRAYGGDEWIQQGLHALPGGAWAALWLVLLVMFFLGFVLDFIEITFVVVPLVAPALLASGFDPVWLGVMFALVLQTSFLTPPFGFSLFYLRGVAPARVHTAQIYRGVLPFILLQWLLIAGLMVWPGLATWLPHWVYG
jgi:tripartite ATP-independent transporter DctM subunit